MKMKSLIAISVLSTGFLSIIPAYASSIMSTNLNLNLNIINMTCPSKFSLTLLGPSSTLEHLSIEGIGSSSGNGSLPISNIESNQNTFLVSLGSNCNSTKNMSIRLKAFYPENTDILRFQSESPLGSQSQLIVNGNIVNLNNGITTSILAPH